MPIFAIRDRASGWFMTIDAHRKGLHWKLVKEQAFAYLIDGPDERDPRIRKAVAIMQEYFGENPKNGFELYVYRVAG